VSTFDPAAPPPRRDYLEPARPPWPSVKKKRPVGKLITIISLSIAFASALALLLMYVARLDEANTRILEQQREIEEQEILIDKKETFGAAMKELLDSASQFDGTLMADLVPFSDYETVARQAWVHRWDASSVDADTATVRAFSRELASQAAAASVEASTNVTGSTYESVIDSLGAGFVSTLIEDADTLCKKDVLACVVSDDPYTIHFDAASNAQPFMNEWIRTGIAYHEFAHVLQFTNPTPTSIAVKSFDDDWETMADCFALTYLDGWKLDHRVWTGNYRYWDVDIGYGYTCNETQRQVVRDWYGQLGFRSRPIAQ
jgi:hypothetical protein